MSQPNTFTSAQVKKFAFRFLCSFVVLGIVYVAIYGVPRSPVHQPATITQKYAALKVAITQSNITETTLASFQENSAVSYDTLGNLINALRNNSKALTAASLALGEHLPSSELMPLQALTAKQAAAIKTLDTHYALLSIVMAYDPATDMGNFDIRKDATKVATRANTAQNGLKTVIQSSDKPTSNSGLSVDGVNGAPALLSPDLKAKIDIEKQCFARLTAQLDAGQFDQAAASRTACTEAYPELRHLAIRSTIDSAITSDYQQYMRQTAQALLKQLSSLQNQS